MSSEGSASGGSSGQGNSGSESEGEEQDEPSSSVSWCFLVSDGEFSYITSICHLFVLQSPEVDSLDSFRQKWQRELKITSKPEPKIKESEPNNTPHEDQEESVEDKVKLITEFVLMKTEEYQPELKSRILERM